MSKHPSADGRPRPGPPAPRSLESADQGARSRASADQGARSRASAGRVAAAEVLLAVEEGAHAEDELARRAPATPADRGLAWFLVMGVLRRRASIDGALRPYLQSPLGGLDPQIRACLRIGAFELLHARTATHAAVSQAVELARALGAGRGSGLVNAVLRRVSDRAAASAPTDALSALLDPAVTPERQLTRPEILELPSWLASRWDERYGPDATEAYCRACQEAAPTFIVARDPSAPADRVAPGLELGATDVPGVWRLPEHAGAIPALPGFADGRWWVQDPAAVRVADRVGAKPGMRVLDACAAPGGKSFRLASQGATVVAVDRNGDRLARVSEGAKRLGLPIRTVIHDWTAGPLTGHEPFDAVLVDAPCTGLGTIRRHPEIKWRRVEPDLAEVSQLQAVILDRAAGLVAPGGRLVYAVCSPEPEEGQAHVERFSAAHAELRLDHVWPPELGSAEDAHWSARWLA